MDHRVGMLLKNNKQTKKKIDIDDDRISAVFGTFLNSLLIFPDLASLLKYH